MNHRFFGDVTNEIFDSLVDDLRAGRLGAQVPPHGTLVRVRREGGLRVDEATICSERLAAAEPAPDRAAAPATERAAKPTAKRAATPTPERAAKPTTERAAKPTAKRAATPTPERAAKPTTKRAATPTPERAAKPTAKRAAKPRQQTRQQTRPRPGCGVGRRRLMPVTDAPASSPRDSATRTRTPSSATCATVGTRDCARRSR